MVQIIVQQQKNAFHKFVSGNRETSWLRSLVSLFYIFLKIGAFTWGGGYAMLPLIRNEISGKKKWLTSEDFINGIAVSQSIPGSIAINIAAYVGNKVAGLPGTIAAVLGAILPSFVVIVLVAVFFLRFREFSLVQNFFKGATPAIAALLASAVVDLGKTALKGYRAIIISAGLLFLLLYFHLHPIFALLIAVALGFLLERRR
jgi:chromate transporter